MAGKKQNKNNKKNALRGSSDITKLAKQVSQAISSAHGGVSKNHTKTGKQKTKQKSVSVYSPPVTIGTTMTSMKPSVSAAPGGGVRIRGREFLTSLPENNQTNWYLSAIVPLHPAYFTSTVVSNYAKSYQHWRCNGVTVHFITRQPSSATGEILMVHTANVIESALPYNASDFLSRALSCENAILGPIWTNHSLPVKPWGTKAEVNAFMDLDINDNIYGEVSVFTQSAVTDTAGFLVMDYDFTFETPMYSPHSNRLPIPTGISDVCVSSTSLAPSAAAQFILVLPTQLAGTADGTIFKIVMNASGTSFPAPITAANALRTWIPSAVTTGLTIPLQDGTTFYGFVTNNTIRVYTNLQSTQTASTMGQVEYNTSGTAHNYAYTLYMVQFPQTWTSNST